MSCRKVEARQEINDEIKNTNKEEIMLSVEKISFHSCENMFRREGI
jgi:hypothetical protein